MKRILLLVVILLVLGLFFAARIASEPLLNFILAANRLAYSVATSPLHC